MAAPARVVGRFSTSPGDASNRRAEGGLRLQGRRKASQPGMPLVTVLTVCLNAARTLEQAMWSVFDQSYQNVEYVVVDGASTDGTAELLRRYDDRIDYFVSEPDGGLYKAMNKGLGLASGDLILILNADDWYVQDAVATLVGARSYSGKDIVSALARYVDGEGGNPQVFRSIPFDAGVRLRMPLRHETMLVPAALYDRFGPYDDSYRVIADFAFTMRLFDAGITHYEVPKPLLNFRTTGVSSTDTTRLAAERRRLLRARFPALDDEDLDRLHAMARLRPEHIEPLARKHAGDPDFVEALRCFQRSQSRRVDAPAWARHRVDWDAIDRASSRPLVSVILPIYAAQTTLRAAIDSVLAQTLASLELVCVNDATPDDSQAIVDDYAARDPRVRSIVNECNLGLGASRNRGIGAARGAYVFHLDPDDTIPPTALERLYVTAAAQGSQIVKGAYLREQMVHGKAARAERKSLVPAGETVPDVSLAKMPELLRTTEGHWSCLYEAGFARRASYPVDLKMGQDSILLVHALTFATSVSVIGDDVYHYRANADSAMNTFTERKFRDSVEWRRRAWHVLDDHGFRSIGDRLLSAYWNPEFFLSLANSQTAAQAREVLEALGAALQHAGLAEPTAACAPRVAEVVRYAAAGRLDNALAACRARNVAQDAAAITAPALRTPSATLRVATFCSMDHGGAGTGSQRRVEALRKHGIDASIHALVVRSSHPYVHRIVPRPLPGVEMADGQAIWEAVRQRAIAPVKSLPGFRAAEVFSLPESVIDFRDLGPLFDAHDVLHFHWVVGLFDYARAGDVLAEKPVVWTLADMNAFTGGCHYSEGCEEYRRECRNCPLLSGQSDLAHQTWRRKREAYASMRRLHIVCPSKWMAERVRASSLLGDKQVHYIPNAFPVGRFAPINKTVARLRLGLPVDRKLILFGADSLDSKRKGGDLLKEALAQLRQQDAAKGVEVILFGHRSLDLPLPSHSLGHISDDVRLALVYSAADAFVFPSLEDNAPLTVGEALLCGTPVVAFPVGNVPDVTEHLVTGYLAQPANAEDLARGIRWALDVEPAEALRRSLRCRVAASRVHDPSRAADAHRAVYEEVMSHG